MELGSNVDPIVPVVPLCSLATVIAHHGPCVRPKIAAQYQPDTCIQEFQALSKIRSFTVNERSSWLATKLDHNCPRSSACAAAGEIEKPSPRKQSDAEWSLRVGVVTQRTISSLEPSVKRAILPGNSNRNRVSRSLNGRRRNDWPANWCGHPANRLSLGSGGELCGSPTNGIANAISETTK